MKQLNYRHFTTNSKKFFEKEIFPERSKNGSKKASVILSSISRSFRPFYEGLEGGGGGGGGPDPARIPAPFSRETRIPHVFHQFPQSRFYFPQK